MEHYYSENPTSKLKVYEINAFLRGNNIRLLTSSGVFSKGRIDFGTLLLIENAIIQPKWTILDLGCGYGVIGIALKKAFPDVRVIMVDINKRAIDLARKNAKINNVDVEIFQGNLYEPLPFEKPFFDSILVNPPMSAGREICKTIIDESFSWIKNNGILQIVAKHKKGGDYLRNYMKGVFGNVETIAKKKGFHVYYSIKNQI